MVDPTAGTAVIVRLATDLAGFGYTAWRQEDEARQALGEILLHVQMELERNWKSLQDAHAGSADERLETQVYEASVQALAPALSERRSLLDALQLAYRPITPGAQQRLGRQPWADEVQAEFEHLWCLVGRASWEIDGFLGAEGPRQERPSDADCTFRWLGDLVAGWPPALQLQVCERWRQFQAAARADAARLYWLDEVQAVSMYVEPARELGLRQAARGRWGWLHSHELEQGVHELWISPSTRILFAESAGALAPLDVVQLGDRDQDGWTPRRYVRRARCRLRDRARRYRP